MVPLVDPEQDSLVEDNIQVDQVLDSLADYQVVGTGSQVDHQVVGGLVDQQLVGSLVDHQVWHIRVDQQLVGSLVDHQVRHIQVDQQLVGSLVDHQV